MREEQKIPSAENPVKLLKLEVKPAKHWAAGIPAVLAALSDLREEHIAIRGMIALFKMNQRGAEGRIRRRR